MTADLRFLIDHFQRDTVIGKICRFLYEINLVDGLLVRGVRREAEASVVHQAANKLAFKAEGYSISELNQVLNLEATNSSTMVTKLEAKGIVVRNRSGRKQYLSLKWDLVLQIHEAFTTGRLVPAEDIFI